MAYVGLKGPWDIQKEMTRREAIGFTVWTRRNAWAAPKNTGPCDARCGLRAPDIDLRSAPAPLAQASVPPSGASSASWSSPWAWGSSWPGPSHRAGLGPSLPFRLV